MSFPWQINGSRAARSKFLLQVGGKTVTRLLRAGSRRGGGRRRRYRARDHGRIEPARMDPGIQGFGRLGIGNAEANQAAEAGLHMGARTAETVIQLQVAEGGVQVVA